MAYFEGIEITCKNCGSPELVKYGKIEGVQYYWCNACKHKVTGKDTLPKMKTPIPEIASALNGYYGGEPLDAIQNRLRQDFHDEKSEAAIYKWIVRFTEEAIREAKDFTPKVGDVWIADETALNIGNNHRVWFWDIIDTKTRYLLASHISETRYVKDAQILFEQAIKRAGKAPRVIITDKMKAYPDGVDIATLGMSQHIQSKPFTSVHSTSLIERFHGILKQRTHAIHHFQDIDTARILTQGWLIHYNFFRDSEIFGNESIVKHMNVQAPFSNWEDIVRNFDRKNEVEREPYTPQPQTTAIDHWDLMKAHQREINMLAYGKRAQQRPHKRPRRPALKRVSLPKLVAAPKPRRNVPSIVVSVRMDRDKKR
ncbi:MAG: DDE-type integrase/transposase/recombinase [Dehalococcoidia bacterium]|jgi:transposase-like protein